MVDPGKRTVVLVLLIMMSSVWAKDRLINPSKLEMFVDKLPDMPKVQGFDVVDGVPRPKSLNIGMYETRWKFHRDVPPTPVFTFRTSPANATHILPWDPTIPTAVPRIQRGIPTVVHLHGRIDEPERDGHSDSWFTAGFRERGPKWTKEKYHYHNKQHPGNMWYHDHAMGLTGSTYCRLDRGLHHPPPGGGVATQAPACGEFDHPLVVFGGASAWMAPYTRTPPETIPPYTLSGSQSTSATPSW
ncbi:hypothetical protein NL676_036576 [Syzygium grande]|nr:hypothetical protein NL676_036576 [Syzygium grande]